MPGFVHAALCAMCLFLACAKFAVGASRPNIILVMADDQGWGDMAYNGHPTLKTPNFDAAAATGLRFDRFYAAAPVCSPTRASVMTGRNPNRMGVFQWGYPIRPQEETIAETLKAAGYATGHFGKWHLGSVRNGSPASPGANGFDAWLSAPNFFENDPILSRSGNAVQFLGESSMVTAEAALEWIAPLARSGTPFFAVVWFGSPHRPHVASERDRVLYADQPAALREFYGEISGMDRAFGVLRDALVELNIRDNTILWYCSDNGALPNIGSTGGLRGAKGQVYEGGLAVPAILEWPERIPAPWITQHRSCTSDIFPTLLEAVGVESTTNHEIDGVSLVAVIDRQKEVRAKPIGFWHYRVAGIQTPSDVWMRELLDAQKKGGDLPPNEASRLAADLPDPPYPADVFPGHSAWLNGDWKLHRIENEDGRVAWELYHLVNDPAEEVDLSSSESARVATMRDEMLYWLNSVVRSLNGNDY